MSYRNDGDALLARNDALSAENERLRQENERLKVPAPSTALVAPPRAGDHSLVVQAPPTARWKKWGTAAILWIAAIGVAILQGIIPLR